MPPLHRAATAAVAALACVAAVFAPGAASATVIGAYSGPVVASDQHAGGAGIDWAQVAGAGSRLAVVEATDGAHYRNPWFASDYAGAYAAGLVRGSYAVGRPALPVVATARQQADYYLARVGSSLASARTLPPVLDLETTGGLTQGQLVTWAQTFLLQVRAKTGRVPVLRTFPYFWANALGDPDAFARFPLWLGGNGGAAPAGTSLWTYAAAAGVPGSNGVRAPAVTVSADDVTWATMRDGRLPATWTDAPPGPPEQVRARAWDRAATVTWLPGDPGSSDVTAYRVVVAETGAVYTVPGDATQARLTGLANGTSYTVSVTAENAVGPGVASAQPATVTPAKAAGALPAGAPARQRSLYTNNCGPAPRIVPGMRWKRAHPAPGVVLQEGQRRDSRGIVRMHVLRVNVGDARLRFAPLMRHVADRQRLSTFRGDRRLVAATNAGYFDLSSGAPTDPVVVDGLPVFGPTTAGAAVGIGADRLMASANVAASGTVAGPDDTFALAGWNSSQPSEGVNVYSGRWGRHRVPVPRDAASRLVRGGVVVSGTGRTTRAPTSGYLLVARGRVAVGWLRSLSRGDQVRVQVSLMSSRRQPFRLAYAVGRHLVTNGVAGTRMSCKRTERLPARTAIGWTKDRRQLVLVAVDKYSKLHLHGVEPDQMAQIMRDLGAHEAYMFDGGGSTEMLVRRKPGAKLVIRNHPSDGRERAMPLGFGIYRR